MQSTFRAAMRSCNYLYPFTGRFGSQQAEGHFFRKINGTPASMHGCGPCRMFPVFVGTARVHREDKKSALDRAASNCVH